MKSDHQIFYEFSASVNTKWPSLNTHNFGSTWPILKKLYIWNQEKNFYKHTKFHKNLREWVAFLKFSGSVDMK